jgi:flagellin
MANSGHNYSKVFGDGTTTDLTNKGDSSFTVSASANEGITFQVGANEGDMMSINIEKMDAQTLGVTSAKVDTQAAASAAIKSVDSAINAVSAQRATLGAIQNRLQYKIDNLGTSSTNLTSAESQIRDVDMAKQMTEFTNANILSQAATAMLAQANSLPQSVLSLIGK